MLELTLSNIFILFLIIISAWIFVYTLFLMYKHNKKIKQNNDRKKIWDEIITTLEESNGEYTEKVQKLIQKYKDTYHNHIGIKEEHQLNPEQEKKVKRALAKFIEEVRNNGAKITKEAQLIVEEYEDLPLYREASATFCALYNATLETEAERFKRGLTLFIGAIRAAEGKYTDEIDLIRKKYADTKDFTELTKILLFIVEIKIPEQSH